MSRSTARGPGPVRAESTCPASTVESSGSPTGALRTHQPSTRGESGTRSSPSGRVPTGTTGAVSFASGSVSRVGTEGGTGGTAGGTGRTAGELRAAAGEVEVG